MPQIRAAVARLACVLIGVSAAPAVAQTPAPAPAQPVAAPAPPPPPLLGGSISLALVGTSGNSSTNSASANGEFLVRPGAWRLRTHGALVRNRSNGSLTAQSAALEQRADRSIASRVSLFGEFDYFRDRFAGVARRQNTTGGLSVALAKGPRQTLKIDAGAGYLSERRLAGANVSSGSYALGGSYTVKLSPTAEFRDDAKVTGTFPQAADWRLAQTAALTARLTRLLSLKVSNGVQYVNLPATGFKRTDTTTEAALVVAFGGQP